MKGNPAVGIFLIITLFMILELTRTSNPNAQDSLPAQNEPYVRHFDEFPWETASGIQDIDDANVVRWKQLASSDRTPSHGLNIGILEFPEGGELQAHRHDPQEAYWVYAGNAELILGEDVYQVRPGTMVYIPENTVHGIRNTGAEPLRLIWTFPVDAWSEVQYNYID